MSAPAGGAGPTAEEDELLVELRRVLHRVDPAPAELTELARSLFSWRDPDALLAELVADSRELAGAVRGDTDVVLRFEAGDVGIVVQLSPVRDEGQRLVGQVEPPAAGTVQIRRSAEDFDVRTDELGRFAVDRLPRGLVSLRWTPDGGDQQAVETAWQVM